MNPILYSSALLFVGTALGSLLVLLWRKPFSYHTALSFSGGVMLVASFLSLIVPGIEKGGFLPTSAGILTGFALLGFIENLFPHEHTLKGYEGRLTLGRSRRLLLIALGVIIHNIPEGLSVGIAGAHSDRLGQDLAIAIAIQDMPEGLVVSLTLYLMTSSLSLPILVGVLSGLLESAFALLGYLFFETFGEYLAFGLGFGGGAMLYVTVKEVFPEVYADEKANLRVTLGFLAGFMLMLLLDTL